MNGSAMILMVSAMAFIWGGLIWSSLHLLKNPDLPLETIPLEHHD
ncbi:methionine/alanine import family NSS transporter small subunit [Moraxella osloensis]|nr:methionine/alanine import family NSS transporter small subunit [Moraxella osloensis]MBL7666897.1 methionine/alanine import family NSS transporter small subunit [Moraxella osloensis]